MYHVFLGLAAGFGFLSVGLGAFAAHGLKRVLSTESLAIFTTAAQYQMYHALALILVALLIKQSVHSVWLLSSGWLFITGIILFSGSLYALSCTGIRLLGAITPLGGLCFLLGWLCLIIAAFKHA